MYGPGPHWSEGYEEKGIASSGNDTVETHIFLDL